MWDVTSEPLSDTSLAPVSAGEVLYEFDGPRVFTSRLGGRLVLVYQCDEDDVAARYVVVPTTGKIIDDLKTGELAVRDALSQPWVWLFEQSHAMELLAAWQLDTIEDVPAGRLPVPGTMLWPWLAPALTMKLEGPSLRKGEVTAGVVSRAVNGATGALKSLVDVVTEAGDSAGRPAERVRSLYNLRVQRFAFASFEMSFREPVEPGQQPLLGDDKLVAQASEEVARLLTHGLSWSIDNGCQLPGDQPSRLAVLSALDSLSPPKHGDVWSVSLSGRMVKLDGPCVLTRRETDKIKAALLLERASDNRIVTITGRVRELDKDKLTLIVRDIAGSDQNQQRCTFEETILDDANSAQYTDALVTVVGREIKSRNIVQIIAMDSAN